MLSAARSAHCPKIADDDLRAWHSRVLARCCCPSLLTLLPTHFVDTTCWCGICSQCSIEITVTDLGPSFKVTLFVLDACCDGFRRNSSRRLEGVDAVHLGRGQV